MYIRFRKGPVFGGLVAVFLVGAIYLYVHGHEGRPQAGATFIAGPLAPDVRGTATFRNVDGGTLITVEVAGLPPYRPAGADGSEPVGPHGFHIHENASCEVGDPDNPFLAAGGHWNPAGQPHGNHAGDLPVLFSNDGIARMTFFTDKFTADEVVGRTLIIHLYPDDYRTQPAGNAGPRLACGIIVRYAGDPM